MATVGCETADGLIITHDETVHCDVCKPVLAHAAIVQMIKKIINYREVKVCKHLVVLDILNALYAQGITVSEGLDGKLIDAVMDADDQTALNILNRV